MSKRRRVGPSELRIFTDTLRRNRGVWGKYPRTQQTVAAARELSKRINGGRVVAFGTDFIAEAASDLVYVKYAPRVSQEAS